jgi:hypothetical protein
MRRLVSFSTLLVFTVLLLPSCSVNSYTGSITVSNETNLDCSNVKVGTVNVGLVGRGQTTTIYFSQAATGAIITATGFVPFPTTLSGKIDLNLDFQYYMYLQKGTDGKYYYTMSGERIEATSGSDIADMQ